MSPRAASTHPGLSASTEGQHAKIVPALTILCHPDLGRVGESVWLEELADPGAEVPLSRLSPLFSRKGAGERRDLADTHLSRDPALTLIAADRGHIFLRSGGARAVVEVQGATLERDVPLTPAEVRAGVVLTVGRRIALCLHYVDLHPERSAPGLDAPELDPSLGFVGSGQGIEEVRQKIRLVAGQDVPVLVRGETGSGKELVANAIVALGTRAKRPFVAVNMATIAPAMGVSELFGHERGAFTGAAGSQAGRFGEADGGTLFLDEIAELSLEVQRMLLRALEDSQIRALGSSRTRKVDVRLVTATDKDLEAAVRAEKFDQALFYRLAGFQIWVPPLRQRREDFGELFVHFLKEHLALTGELHRLDRPSEDEKPWLSATKLARLAMAPWPGNVRALKRAVGQIVIASQGQPRAKFVHEAEALAHGGRPVASPSPQQEVASERTVASQAALPAAAETAIPWEISRDALEETLRRCKWSRSAAATELKIPRATLYALAEKYGMRSLNEHSDAELIRIYNELGGDLDRMGHQVQASRRAIQLRMTQVLRTTGKPPGGG